MHETFTFRRQAISMRTIFIFLVIFGSLSSCSAFSSTWKVREVSTLQRKALNNDNDKAEQDSLMDSDGFKTKKIDTGDPWYHRLQRKKEAKAYEDMMVGLSGGLRPLSLKKAKKPGTLILVRHGQSEGAKEGRFIGWSDPPLTPQGTREAQHAARLLRESGYDITVVFTSYLNRAIYSTWAILRELDESYLPVFKSWRLMERSYGALTGLSKSEVASQMGVTRVQKWRTDPHAVPPPLSVEDAQWPGKRRKFSKIKDIPASESLVDCTKRLQPLWQDKIVSELEVGHNVLVVGHGSTLRGIIKFIEGLSDLEAYNVQVPPGSPIVYEFDRDMQVIPSKDTFSVKEVIMGTYLEKPGQLQKALELESEWRSMVPGHSNATWAEVSTLRHMSSLERSLMVLREERDLEEWVDKGKDGAIISSINDTAYVDVTIPDGSSSNIHPVVIKGHPCLAPLPQGVELPDDIELPGRKGAVIVMIRHGKTDHNKLSLFTGWEDPPLASEGVEEAKLAGKMLKKNGFEFDIVYTSWLSRAIETSWHVLDGLDSTWLPIVKSWRLNERHYGDLTGKSKAMISRQFGEVQFKLWRRGYKVKPPALNSFSPEYPGNDKRYQKYLKDLRYSVSETLIRSIGNRRWTPSRKFPKTESLFLCMKRTIPYLTEVMLPKAVKENKRVLIASSENAIRGMLMKLCDIPEEMISELSIPNGVPMIYDVKSRCLKLLDDGSGVDPLEKYNFGPAARYLFRERKAEEVEDELCDLEALSEEAQRTLSEVYSSVKTTSPSEATRLPESLWS